MSDAPLTSTMIALALIPVSFLITHAYLSGRKGGRFHRPVGILAIAWDLSVSIGYMVMRALGLQVEGSTLVIKGAILAYFIVHGTIAVIVISLEFGVLSTGLLQWRTGKKMLWHKRLSNALFFLWWFAFLSGELFYVYAYVI